MICVHNNTCKLYKVCPHCAIARQNRLGYHAEKLTRNRYNLYHLIIGLPLTGESRRSDIKQLTEQFKALRRLACWDVVGGLRAIEEGANGNIHIHSLIEGNFGFNPAVVIAAWHNMGGTIDLNAVVDNKHRTNICYYFNPTKNMNLRDDRIDFAIDTKYMRMAEKFGGWLGTPLIPRHSRQHSNR